MEPDEPIAVVGMAGRFPGAESTADFWEIRGLVKQLSSHVVRSAGFLRWSEVAGSRAALFGGATSPLGKELEGFVVRMDPTRSVTVTGGVGVSSARSVPASGRPDDQREGATHTPLAHVAKRLSADATTLSDVFGSTGPREVEVLDGRATGIAVPFPPAA